ncbi:alpha/beta hydrolase [Mumia sp. zg.B53]|uniref:alpha/beta fold hydrolase n=1 Tax=unclassified Mumia TaxID=2621872 RepID=UPI001C6E3831|nr:MULTISPECIES: alpha/beta hydrolase [unclassified Mumia]MBW9207903.1 alpha/beta hydrolase [Mumia sp. zg.B17]MBW9209751.1 alpha/beta hydrolase [Mumia sp. zg.B21]MBW9214354.1 alpha/beta hydrolase [Mumia sp. zg.B53]
MSSQTTGAAPVTAVPAWFSEAVATPYHRHDVDVAGARIAYRTWGEPGMPVVVLVHGGAAHAGWWDHVAPFLAASHRVAAIDLSGHGDSQWRRQYDLATFAEEVMAVAAAETPSGGAQDGVLPVVIGHSMGGFVSLTAARDHGSRLAGACAIDSPVRQMSPETRAWKESGRHLPGNKVYPSWDEIVRRFRTLPPDDATLPYVREHVAAGSVREVEGGWTWKFDPHVFLSAQMEPAEVAETDCPTALVRGERGMATTDITTTVAERLGGHVPVTVVPDAGHHIMLDQPVALVAALQVLLGEWSRH